MMKHSSILVIGTLLTCLLFTTSVNAMETVSTTEKTEVDLCLYGDYSPSAYDGKCEGQAIENYKSPIGKATKTYRTHNSADVMKQTCNRARPSFDCLVQRGRAIGITTATSRTQFNPIATVSRQEAADMMATYQKLFTQNSNKLFAGSQSGSEFLPDQALTQAQAITVMVKLFVGPQEASKPWYASYYTAFNNIMNNPNYILDNHDKEVTRGELLILMFELYTAYIVK